MEVMDERKIQLLQYIVEDYIETAEPVASGQLVAKYNLGVSPATVRNDMSALEYDGYLESPHTSAGRIPTELGYKAYYEFKRASQRCTLTASEQKQIESAHKQYKDIRSKTKCVARVLAELANGAVIIGFDKNDVYYTGISHLFAQPEFNRPNSIYGIGVVVDRLEERVPEVFETIPEQVTVRIGSDNPFSDVCTFIGFTFIRDKCQKLFGLMGSTRMDYIRNVERISYVRKLLTN